MPLAHSSPLRWPALSPTPLPRATGPGRRRLALISLISLGALAFGCGQPKRPDGGEGLLPVGAQAPDLEGINKDGKSLRLGASSDKFKVVYFYPRDGTPGCTKEACAFRDAYAKLDAAGVLVFGVSKDSRASHAAFAKEHSLPFYLTADESGAVLKAYGVGSTLGMASRVTFLVGRDNRVLKVFPNVDPAVHVDEVLAALPK